ncbi:MAG: SgcJ/EcaC family oxidoreductase [Gemmataceae bacterium]
MRARILVFALFGVVALFTFNAFPGGRRPPATSLAAFAGEEKDREADSAAIRATAKEFMALFAKADAKGVAALWASAGEYHDERGDVVRGREALETVFAKFFKENPKARLEIHIDSIRFLGPDCAIEEGLLRQASDGAELPASTQYRAVHVRQGGVFWRMALVEEWGAGRDRLADLDWLIGEWQGGLKDDRVTIAFAKDAKKPYVTGRVTKTAKGKEASSSSIRIAFDRNLGKLRAWHFEDDGGHGESLWVRDGNRWVMDAVGVLADGTEFRAVNMLTRLRPDEIIWRSIDRVVGDDALPDTLPVKLTRVTK